MPEPSKIPAAWAWDGDINTIPATDPGNGLASWELGYPIETQTPIAAGGTPPRRQDMNGALNALSNGQLWYQQGGLWQYDALVDYEVGNHILENGSLYYCIAANGPSGTVKSPSADTSGTYWKPIIFANGRHPDPDHLLQPAVLQVLQAVYPVGSIYCSYGSTSPAVLFGFGTWAKIEGRFLLGANSTYGLGSTGGAATVTLTVNQIPAHNHGASSASAGAHTHTVTVNEAGLHAHTASSNSTGAHTHTITVASGGTHNHTATTASAGAHTHTITVNNGGDHTHTASSASAGAHTHTASSNQTGAHTHTRGTMEITGSITSADPDEALIYADQLTVSGAFQVGPQVDGPIAQGSGGKVRQAFYFTASRSWTGSTSSAGAHSHTITVNSAGSHSHDITVNKGGVHNHTASSASNGAHTHTVMIANGGAHTHNASSASAGNHSHTITVNDNGKHVHTASSASAGAHTHGITVSNTGGGQSHSNMPPYMAVNIWRRTA